MVRPNYVYHVKASIDGGSPLDLTLELDANRRSARGALTVHAFDVRVNGHTIVAWQSTHGRKRATSQNKRAQP